MTFGFSNNFFFITWRKYDAFLLSEAVFIIHGYKFMKIMSFPIYEDINLQLKEEQLSILKRTTHIKIG